MRRCVVLCGLLAGCLTQGEVEGEGNMRCTYKGHSVGVYDVTIQGAGYGIDSFDGDWTLCSNSDIVCTVALTATISD